MTSDPQRPPERREIRLFPDCGRRYPLWENSTPTWDVGYATGPGTYGLSKELAEDLEDWQFFWETHQDPDDGWDEDANERTWLHDGDLLAGRLREEVHAFADVKCKFNG